jgi:hypothetical protein
MSDYRCYRAERCRDAEATGDDLAGARIHTETGLCLTCTGIIEQAITELPRDYLDLELALPATDTQLAEPVTGSKDPPAPLRVPLAALAAEIVATVTAWTEPVADRLRIDWDTRALDRELADGTILYRRMRPGPTLQRAARILAPNLPVLLNLRQVEVTTWADNGCYWHCDPADGIDGALDMLAAHQRVRAALGRTHLVHRLGVACPSVDCESLALVRHNGADEVTCESCGRWWPHDQWQRLTVVATAA